MRRPTDNNDNDILCYDIGPSEYIRFWKQMLYFLLSCLLETENKNVNICNTLNSSSSFCPSTSHESSWWRLHRGRRKYVWLLQYQNGYNKAGLWCTCGRWSEDQIQANEAQSRSPYQLWTGMHWKSSVQWLSNWSHVQNVSTFFIHLLAGAFL